MTLYNADGSPSELSGNGLRCLAALVLHQRARQAAPPLERSAGRHRRRLEDLDAGRSQRGRYTFRAAMGAPTDVREETLDVAGETHARDDARAWAIRSASRWSTSFPTPRGSIGWARRLSTHRRFPAGTNVEFARVEAPDQVRILIWERGVGPTTASGTGACAAAVAAIAHGGAARDIDVIAARRYPAGRMARRRRLPDRMGGGGVRRLLDTGKTARWGRTLAREKCARGDGQLLSSTRQAGGEGIIDGSQGRLNACDHGPSSAPSCVE